MDKPPPTEFDPYAVNGVRMEMVDVPKSTLAVAVLLWGVLATLAGWTLNVVSDMRSEQRGQSEAIKALNARQDVSDRLIQRNSDDIRDLQRGAK